MLMHILSTIRFMSVQLTCFNDIHDCEYPLVMLNQHPEHLHNAMTHEGYGAQEYSAK